MAATPSAANSSSAITNLRESHLANRDHSSRLKRNVDAWIKWRKNNPGIRPALSGVDLIGANLIGAYLSRANFSGADLIGANLSGANLIGANLRGVDLTEANLILANLSGANLFGADLNGANLTWANLSEANLTWANLSEANLTRTTLSETVFGNTNLSHSNGLDSCVHLGPSILDHRTLLKSGKLPLNFLHGCGLPDALINYLPSLLNEPFQFYSCFISYSSIDDDFAKRLHADLQGQGIRCWFAPEDIQGGKKTHEQIDQAIRKYDRLLLILSEHSMNSEWVEFEIRKARKLEVQKKKRVLFPIRLVSYKTIKEWECFDADTKKDLATEIREYHIPDFSDWKNHNAYAKGFERLLRDLKAEATAP